MVYIDAKGSLSGIDQIWRTIRDVYDEEVELRSLETAQEEARQEFDRGRNGVITIDDVRFGYFENGCAIAIWW
jgi:hypothetical protein